MLYHNRQGCFLSFWLGCLKPPASTQRAREQPTTSICPWAFPFLLISPKALWKLAFLLKIPSKPQGRAKEDGVKGKEACDPHTWTGWSPLALNRRGLACWKSQATSWPDWSRQGMQHLYSFPYASNIFTTVWQNLGETYLRSKSRLFESYSGVYEGLGAKNYSWVLDFIKDYSIRTKNEITIQMLI